ncbi:MULTISPECIES: alkaline phosphatase family protein [unclassified Bradyrhizobium]|uniref:phospholipase C n=1 Tax=unclassified Bradyrhizobium TaxID=2631580 RepID=UPI002479DD11|nr:MULTISPECIES: alkaline phosphatase family protein [unclassified Bradyrhizobium]WGS18084.1 alkaline phosphatase family protein [Bradyrhizobium sp. ISRA463]WGS24897.1 alkaline phosphatase family protein [Bradyrhizobium sp. ISRA464]
MHLSKTLGLVSVLALTLMGAGAVAEDDHGRSDSSNFSRDHHVHTATPIKHLVVIFQENVSFDHYFGTYPNAENRQGETPFHAKPSTPVVNSLKTPLDVNHGFSALKSVDLLAQNPNSNASAPVAPNNNVQNGAGASNPFRLAPGQALTADQGHNEAPEESAYNNGHMDGFPAFTGTAGPPPAGIGTKALVMGYYDGNTVTALWNYAQHFAMNDNSYSSQFGPSTPGALNLIAGQTNGLSATMNVINGSGTLLHPTHEAFGDASHTTSNLTLIGDADPIGDVCSNPTGDQVTLGSRNIGDLLNDKGITWGAFMGGFDLSVVNANKTTGCQRETDPVAPGTAAFTSVDYIPHHAWFQYYASTRNPQHTRPSSVEAIGHSFIPGTKTPEPANHQYDSNDFFAALKAHNLPSVSFLKAPAYQDGHAGYSDPLDEQNFIVSVVNAVQQSGEWEDTAIIIAYDDSDGWYDHQMPPIVNTSANPTVDTLNGPGVCNTSNGSQQGRQAPSQPLNGNFGQPAWGRCGYGTRQPLLVISPFAKRNYVDHTLTDQSSVLRFIEDNWLNRERIQPGGSFDTIAGPLDNMFDFDHRDEDHPRKLILNPNDGTMAYLGH